MEENYIYDAYVYLRLEALGRLTEYFELFPLISMLCGTFKPNEAVKTHQLPFGNIFVVKNDELIYNCHADFRV